MQAPNPRFLACCLWSVLLFGLPCAAVAPPAAADLVITVEYKDLETSPPTTSQGQIFLAADRLRMDVPADQAGGEAEASAMVYRGDLQQLMVIDHGRQMYMVMDKESMNATAGRLDEAMKQMQAQLEQMPEEQRKQMEQYMKGHMPSTPAASAAPVIEVKKTDRKQTINGHACVCYETLVDGTKQSEAWVTSWKSAGIERQGFQAFRDMAAFYRGLIESVPTMGKQLAEQDIFGGIEKIDGFPVLIREFDGDTITGETLFQSADEQKVDPATYAPPAGYKQHKMG